MNSPQESAEKIRQARETKVGFKSSRDAQTGASLRTSVTSRENLLSGLSILIVEDEPLVAMIAEEFSDELGCKIRHTEVSTTTALAAIDAFKPDIAVVDVNLNSLGASYEVADRLKERGIPFVFSSGHRSSELPLRYAGHRFLAKPFSKEEFSAALESVRD